jgi:8-oxo-dGTP pyrophosphatase MutT (NUDIX family)
MPLTLTVPRIVQEVARKALETGAAGREGRAVAEQLTSGSVTLDVVSRLQRFFTVSAPDYRENLRCFKGADESETVRLWDLYGGDEGRAWSEREYASAVREGLLNPDPWIDLMKLRPEEVYERFSLGAWRYEYGLDPRKAARFVENYTRATGLPLDLARAFGRSAPAVGNAVYRRFNSPNPFMVLARALLTEDAAYRLGAEVDFASMEEGSPLLDEALMSKVWTQMQVIPAGKIVWPTLVAYFVLAVERPELLQGVNGESKKPAQADENLLNWQQYNDAINLVHAYFHPKGAKYVDPTTYEVKGEKENPYLNVDHEMLDLAWRAWKGLPIQPTLARKRMTLARQWTSVNKLSTILFGTLLARWLKGDWAGILDALPDDSDIRAPFAQFVQSAALPKGGPQLQITAVSGKDLQQIDSFWSGTGQSPGDFVQVSFATTATFAKAKALGTPLGIHSVVKVESVDSEILGAFRHKMTGDVVIAFRCASSSPIYVVPDVKLAADLASGAVQALQGHKDIPGTKYGMVPVAKGKEVGVQKPVASLNITQEQIKAYLADALDSPCSFIDMKMTDAFDTAEDVYGTNLAVGTVVNCMIGEEETPLVLLGAVETEDLVNVLVFAKPDKTLHHAFDYTLDKALKTGFAWIGDDAKYVGTAGDYLDAAYDLDDFVEVPWPSTKIHAAMLDKHQVGLAANATVKGSKSGNLFVLLGVFAHKGTGERKVIYKDDEGVIGEIGEQAMADLVTKGKIVPAASNDLSKLSKWASQHKITLAVPQSPGVVAPPPEDSPSFVVGDVLRRVPSLYEDDRWVVVAVGSKSYGVAALNLTIVALGQTTLEVPIGMANGWVKEASGVVVQIHSSTYSNQVRAGSAYTPIPAVEQDKIAKGYGLPNSYASLEVDGEECRLFGFVRDLGNAIGVVIGRIKTGVLAEQPATWVELQIVSTDLLAKKQADSSYAPAVVPEKGAIDTVSTADTSAFMSGTPEAFEFLKKQGWSPAVSHSSVEFEWQLGSVLGYKVKPGADLVNLTITIIGYGLDSDGVAIYVSRTESGSIYYATAKVGNKKYGPYLGMDNAVVKALLPKPGAKYPKLNYTLSEKAKTLAAEEGHVYVPSPKSAPYCVGAKLVWTGGAKGVLEGWIVSSSGASFVAIVSLEGGSVSVQFDDLLKYWGVNYKHGNLVDYTEVVFSKQKEASTITVLQPTGTIPSSADEGTLHPTPVKEPPWKNVYAGDHVGAGIVAVVPPGVLVCSGGGSISTTVPMVVMVHPLNDFGGKLVFPKGTVESGETALEAAVRECREETGMFMRPVCYLGDVAGSSSINRYYMGYVTGGTPQTCLPGVKEETDAVTLKPLLPPDEAKKRPWWKDLPQQSQNVYLLAQAWVQKHGLPHMTPVDAADTATAVTPLQDVSLDYTYKEEATYSPPQTAMKHNQDGWAINYPLVDGVAEYCGALFESDSNVTNWRFIVSTDLINEGYPPPGAVVHYAGEKETVNWRVRAFAMSLRKDTPTLTHAYALIYERLDTGVFGSLLLFTLDIKAMQRVVNAEPSKFTPVEQPTPMSEMSIPVGPGWEVALENLVAKAPFPVDSTMLLAIRQSLAESSALQVKKEGIAHILCVRDLPNAPPCGTIFRTTNPPLTALAGGYLRVMDGVGSSVWVQLYRLVPGQAAGARVLVGNWQEGMEVLQGENWSGAALEAPNPLAKATFEALWQNKGDLAAVGVSLNTLKQWGAQATPPMGADVNGLTPNLVQDFAGLFIPGALHPVASAHLLSALHTNLTQLKKAGLAVAIDTVSTGKVVSPLKPPTTPPVVTAAPPKVAPVVPKKTAPVKVVTGTLYNGPFVKQTVANPLASQFKLVGKGPSGGSNPTWKLEGPSGTLWIAKGAKSGDPWPEARAAGEAAAYAFMSKLTNDVVPVAMMQWEGKPITIQPLIGDADSESLPDPNGLTDENKIILLRQHVVDMFCGDHDGHPGNWLRRKGRLIPIDRGQAFKFYAHGGKLSLDPTFNPNPATAYAKTLLVQWGAKAAEIPPAAFTAMRRVIGAVQAMDNAAIRAILEPYLKIAHSGPSSSDALLTPAQRESVLQRLFKARDNYLDDWTTVLKKMRKDFKWPSVEGGLSFSVSASEMGFTSVETGIVEQDVIEAKWRGKAIRVDGPDFEDQEVLIQRVQVGTSGGMLLTWRVSYEAAREATRALVKLAVPGKNANAEASYSPTSKPKFDKNALPFDAQDHSPEVPKPYFAVIRKAIGNLLYHLKSGSLEMKAAKIQPALDLLDPAKDAEKGYPSLPTLLQLAQAAPGKLKVLGHVVQAAAVAAMCVQYIEYCNQIAEVYADVQQNQKGSKFFSSANIPDFKVFTWLEEPEPETTPEEVAPASGGGFVVEYNAVGEWPNISPQPQPGGDAQLYLSLPHKTQSAHGYKACQYRIADSAGAVEIFFNPACAPSEVDSPDTPILSPATFAGQTWAFVKGEPSSGAIALVLRLWELATKRKAAIATAKDREALYWAKQCYVNQRGASGGPIKPQPHGVGESAPEYRKAMTAYRAGETDKAIKLMRQFVGGQLNVSQDDLDKMVPPDAFEGVYDATGYGHSRTLRLGWDRDRILKEFGPSIRVAHHVHGGNLRSFFQDCVKNNGALVANYAKAFYGVSAGGGSEASDVSYGGAPQIFTVLRKSDVSGPVIYFDPAVLLRADAVIMAANDDGYGNPSRPRYVSLLDIANKVPVPSGGISYGESNQIVFRHTLDLREYLLRVRFGNTGERDFVVNEVIIPHWGADVRFGPLRRTVAQVFVTS